MKERSSTTAEGMALVRAIESSRAESRRICYDPIAKSLVNPVSVFLAKMLIDSGLYARAYTPGAIEFIMARERHVDEFLKRCLAEGLDQVVILGAGFDTRAFRIPGIEMTRVFEVDHPATQAVKVERLKKVIDPLPAHVVFVPMDFNTDSLSDCLRQAGYDECGKTLFIWQGVTMYLPAEGIDQTLAFIANHSATGSAVIFDYFYTELLNDTSRADVRRLRQTMQVIGEQHVFGISEGQAQPFLSQRGFTQVENVDAEGLERLYMNGPNKGRAIAKGAGIASARVAQGKM